MTDRPLYRFIITFSDWGVKKLRQSRVAISARSLTFYEESEAAASEFLIRYIRNFCCVEFSDMDFSIYRPNEGPAPRYGLLGSGEQQASKPGMAGAFSLKD